MKSAEHRRDHLKPLAFALALGVGLSAASAHAQAIIEVGGADTIGDTILTTSGGAATLPDFVGVNWTAAGGGDDDGAIYARLNSPTLTVQNAGNVTLTFAHRYQFENDWDGGTVYISVNGGAWTHAPASAFSQNGYVKVLASSSEGGPFPDLEDAFTSQSTGYDTPASITSIADLGTFAADDTIAIQFCGGWDWGTIEPAPNWEIASVTVTDSSAAMMLDIDFLDGPAGFTDDSDEGLAGPWTYPRAICRFELDADAETADRYKADTPGSVIDLNDADIAIGVLTGTLDAGDTFTLFDLSDGTTLSGNPGVISLPPGTWDTSNLAVDGTIVCTLPLPPFSAPTPPPVTSGMIVWVSGDGVDQSDPGQVRVSGPDTFVTQWNDFSTNDNHATNATANDQPTYIANGLNGKPVLRFGEDDVNNGDRLYLGDLSADFPTAGSVFVVSTIDNDGRYNLFGNRNNDERWVADNWNESRPGSFRGGRSTSANFTMDDWPTTGSHIFALESDSSTFEVLIDGNSIGTDTPDYNSGSGQNWTIGNRATNGQQLQGDIAEVILYNRILTLQEADQVGGYLMQKYRLTTTYPPLYFDVILDSPLDGVAYPSGSSIMASATVDDAGTPPYTVEFFVDDVSAGTATTSDPYTLDLGALADGPHEIYATVTDSATPTAGTATSATHSFTVASATATTTTLASSANPSTYGAATVTATVVAGDASTLSGGTVQFYDGGALLGAPVTVDTATGEASHDISTLGVDTHSITADYSGNGIYAASSASALSQVVEAVPLTVTANHVFRPTGTDNPDPLPYEITGYQNDEDLDSSGVTGDPLLTTDAAPASPVGDYVITCALGSLEATNYSFTLVDGTLTVAEVPDTFSINFYAYGALPTDEAKANVRLDPGAAAGLGDWLTNGWLNFEVPWAPGAPLAPVTLTSNHGSSATFQFKDCRNGGPYVWNVPRTTLLGDGNGNMMDAHINSTLDPGDGSNLFDMEVTDVPFAAYDVIFYMGANQAQFGDGTGVIVFNGGAERAFTLQSGAFDGTFTEMVDATTPGNYIVFKDVTGSSFTTRTWGTGPTGFNHIGPTGLQIRGAASDYNVWTENFPDADLSDPDADFDVDGLSNDAERLFGLDPTDPASLNPFTVPLDAAAGTLSFTRRDDALTGLFSGLETSTDLVMWTEDSGAKLVPGTPDDDAVEIVDVTLSTGLLNAPNLFVRVIQDAGVIFSTNFEDDNGGFSATGTPNDWEWGAPNSDNAAGLILTTGNGGSTKCWGTKLGDGGSPSGVITIGADSILRSPDINLTGTAGAQLQFAAAVDALGDDTLQVLVREVGTDTLLETIIPIEPPATSGWANLGPFAITTAADKNVYLEFQFKGTDGSYIGLYIDDVTVSKLLP